MKPKTYLLLILTSLFTLKIFGQPAVNTGPDMNYVKWKSVYIRSGKRNMKVDNINRLNIKKIFGIPGSIERIKNEMSDAKSEEYHYVNGSFTFEDYELTDFKILKAGWAIVFTSKNGFTKSLTVGSKATELKNIFPLSWVNKDRNMIHIGIKASDNTVTDTFIVFLIKNAAITEINLFSDES